MDMREKELSYVLNLKKVLYDKDYYSKLSILSTKSIISGPGGVIIITLVTDGTEKTK